MKLSMWILDKWLSDYNPTAIIVEGKQSIVGVRLFDESETQDSNYVYLCRMRDFFPKSATDEILLMHNNDVISLSHESSEAILSSINEALMYYNQWEQDLQEAALSETPEQHILDACADIFGPMLLLDLNLSLLAYSKRFGIGEVNPLWDEYLLHRNSPQYTANLMKETSLAKLISQRHNLWVFHEPKAAPFSHGLMVSYLDDDALVGQLIIFTDSELGQHSIQLARSVEKALNSIHAKTSVGSTSSLPEALFTNLLLSATAEPQIHEKLSLLKGWRSGSRFCIITCLPDNYKPAYLRLLKIRLNAVFPDSLVVFKESSLVGLILCTDSALIEQTLMAIVEETGLSFGVSYLFDDLCDAYFYEKQASIACYTSKDTAQPITWFKTCALYAISHSDNLDFIRRSLHPLVIKLVSSDNESMKSYAATLRSFLQHERSFQLTAQALFVHRNTVLYRIQKIQELYELDLDDPDEREYLLASFRVLD